jgi:micrococcal nuclease
VAERCRRWIVLALVAVAGCSGSSPATPTPPSPPTLPSSVGPVLVSRVIDGDTIVVDTVGTVRLIGVDTPETVDPDEPIGCFGPEASAFTRAVSTGRMVRLEFDADRVDRYGRTLAYVYLPDDVFLNATLVQQGYGYAYTFFPFRYLEQFRALEREAREARRGLWASCAASQAAPAARPEGALVTNR